MSHQLHSIQIIRSGPGHISQGFIERLVEFYQRQPKPYLSPIWEGIISLYQRPLIEALKQGNITAVGELLGNAYATHLMAGLDFSPGEEIFAKQFAKVILALGQAVGCVPVFNDRQPLPENFHAGEILDEVEKHIGFQLNHPGGGGMHGVVIADRFLPYKLLDVVNCLLGVPRDWVNDNILEIGAGSGMLAWIRSLMKHERLSSYDVIDIPSTSVITGYLCACAFGESNVWLRGELDRSALVRILGLDFLPWTDYGLACNQDSLPEIPPELESSYIEGIEQRVRPGGIFLSVNHESHVGGQHRVCDFVKTLKPVRRELFWGRPGYVREWWVKE